MCLLQGGESNNIEEQTVMSLFASGYETKVLLTSVHIIKYFCDSKISRVDHKN